MEKDKTDLIKWVQRNKRKTLTSSVKCGYNKGIDHYVTVEYVEDVGAYQIALHRFDGIDIIITLLEFYVNDNWEEVEIDRMEYPSMWHYPQSLDKAMEARRNFKKEKAIS